VQLTEHHFPLARALDYPRFQFLVASPQRITRLDEVGDVGRRAEPSVIFPSAARTGIERILNQR
jgi:hypothetical protein